METMNTVTINNRTLPVKEFNGVRVVTFKDIDELHQRPDGTARRNFNANKERFIEGEDYFKVCANEIRMHKIVEISDKAHEDIVLVTESGYLMITKSFKDELAWQIHRELVNIYFRAKKAETALQNLSPQLQAMISLEVRQNNLESRMNDLERRITTAPEPPEPKKKPQGKPWSEREKDYLRRAYALGQTDVEIAAELGRTVDSIHNKRRVLGLVQVTRPHWSKDEDKKLKRLLNKGLTAPEIGALIGRSADGVLSRKSKLRQKGVKI